MIAKRVQLTRILYFSILVRRQNLVVTSLAQADCYRTKSRLYLMSFEYFYLVQHETECLLSCLKESFYFADDFYSDQVSLHRLINILFLFTYGLEFLHQMTTFV